MKVGAVITFPEGLTPGQVATFLADWQADLVKENSEFAFDDQIQVGEYDPEIGSPVFYVP